MHLSCRPLEPDDLDACWRIVQGDRFYEPALRSSRTQFWGELLKAKSALSVIVEDTDHPLETRARAFSLSVFVTDTFAAAARTSLPPGVASHLHAQAANGTSPILGAGAIGHANARRGLILFAGPFGYAAASTEHEEVRAAEMMFSALFTEHAGYQIKEILLENTDHSKWVASNVAGMFPRTDYSEYFRACPHFLPPPEEHPVLHGLTRAEAFDTLESRFFPLFLYTEPCFGFRPSEQRLLNQSLRGGTNEETAEALSLSLSAIKKSWESIYSRVTLIKPELLAVGGGSETKRGSEKKDRVLTYLRQHPEELRPYVL